MQVSILHEEEFRGILSAVAWQATHAGPVFTTLLRTGVLAANVERLEIMSFSMLFAAVLFLGVLLVPSTPQRVKATVLARGRRRRLKRRARQWYAD